MSCLKEIRAVHTCSHLVNLSEHWLSHAVLGWLNILMSLGSVVPNFFFFSINGRKLRQTERLLRERNKTMDPDLIGFSPSNSHLIRIVLPCRKYLTPMIKTAIHTAIVFMRNGGTARVLYFPFGSGALEGPWASLLASVLLSHWLCVNQCFISYIRPKIDTFLNARQQLWWQKSVVATLLHSFIFGGFIESPQLSCYHRL